MLIYRHIIYKIFFVCLKNLYIIYKYNPNKALGQKYSRLEFQRIFEWSKTYEENSKKLLIEENTSKIIFMGLTILIPLLWWTVLSVDYPKGVWVRRVAYF